MSDVAIRFGRRVANAFAWSAFQSWSVKAFSLIVFFVLARYLSPAQMGVAQAIMLMLAFCALLSEQGLCSAIIQKPTLTKDELNLPFYLSLTVAALLGGGLFWKADWISLKLGAEGAAGMIRLVAIIPLLTACSGILIAYTRRELNFSRVARANLIASFVSGLVAIGLAYYGAGSASLIWQAIISALLVAVLMAVGSGWRPGIRLVFSGFTALFSFSALAFLSQLVDFFSVRMIDFVVIERFGLAALGIYAVGAKLYFTLLELLASAIVPVALTMFSRLAAELGRLRDAYLRIIFISSVTTLPAFVLVAALAPEICVLLFGEKWLESAQIAQALGLLGAVQVVQFFNGAVLMAAGEMQRVLLINIVKLVFGIAVLGFYPASSIQELTWAFVFSQLAVSPLSFWFAATVVRVKMRAVIAMMAPGAISACTAFTIVFLLRSSDFLPLEGVLLQATLYSALYLLVFLLMVACLSGRKLVQEARRIVQIYRH